MTSCCHCLEEEPCAGRIEIFRHLDVESQAKISALARHLTFHKGEVLFSPEKHSGLFLISEGKMKVYEVSPSGKEQLLRILKKGDFAGEEALFGDIETFTFGEALTDLSVCFIRREDFLELLMQFPSISLKLLEEFNRRIIRSGHQTTSNMAEPVQTRLISYLLDLSNAQDSLELTLPMSMRELAAFLSTTPETLSRRIRSLEKEGYLSKKGRKILLKERDALAVLCMEKADR